jgi:undecaprenyl-diphosphatase
VSAWRARVAAVDARSTRELAGILDGLPARWRRIAWACAGLWTHTGDGLVWLMIGVLAWRYGNALWAQLGERIVLATGLAWCWSTILKFLIRRPRPEGAGGHFFNALDSHAFPSGHATRIGALWVAAGLLLPWEGAVALLLWGVSVAVSRVILGLHYVSDIIVGLLAGAITGLVLVLLL